jgi:hypothetical protein
VRRSSCFKRTGVESRDEDAIMRAKTAMKQVRVGGWGKVKLQGGPKTRTTAKVRVARVRYDARGCISVEYKRLSRVCEDAVPDRIDEQVTAKSPVDRFPHHARTARKLGGVAQIGNGLGPRRKSGHHPSGGCAEPIESLLNQHKALKAVYVRRLGGDVRCSCWGSMHSMHTMLWSLNLSADDIKMRVTSLVFGP